MSTDNVMHRELPYAESADLTPDRYHPPRCPTTPGVIFAICIATSDMLLGMYVHPFKVNVIYQLYRRSNRLFNFILLS